MTNTKFRKRALLSSVAMLLVALVALGSATFAWFTEDPDADAQGIPAYAQTSKGLLISTDTDSTPSHHAALAKNIGSFYLAPSTTSDGTNYKTIPAASASSYELDTAETWTGANMIEHVASGTAGVYHEKMYLEMTSQPTGSDTAPVYLKGVTIDLENAAHKMKDALVVTIKYGSTVKHYSYSGDDFGVWSAYTTVTRTTDETLTVDQASTGLSEQVGTFSASVSSVPVDVYVWLNGNDSSVYTDNSDARQLLNHVKFDFSLNA